MAELFTSYAGGTGLIGDTWWQSAVALSTVETYAQTTGDTSYDAAINEAFDLNSAGDFENSSDDDTAWWGLVWLQAYEVTHDRSYLAMATPITFTRPGTAPAAAACGGSATRVPIRTRSPTSSSCN
jgi:rhamnogalacturonyl hydrolase YesR